MRMAGTIGLAVHEPVVLSGSENSLEFDHEVLHSLQLLGSGEALHTMLVMANVDAIDRVDDEGVLETEFADEHRCLLTGDIFGRTFWLVRLDRWLRIKGDSGSYKDDSKIKVLHTPKKTTKIVPYRCAKG